MGLAEIFGGRKVWHDVSVWIKRVSAAAVWNVFEWNYFDFVNFEFSDGGVRYWKRLAVHPLFADIHGDCLVSQKTAERFAGGFAESDCGVESVCGGSVCGRVNGGVRGGGGGADGEDAEDNGGERDLCGETCIRG